LPVVGVAKVVAKANASGCGRVNNMTLLDTEVLDVELKYVLQGMDKY
jgi:hypothetical protein